MNTGQLIPHRSLSWYWPSTSNTIISSPARHASPIVHIVLLRCQPHPLFLQGWLPFPRRPQGAFGSIQYQYLCWGGRTYVK